jgi:hypothetical protein
VQAALVRVKGFKRMRADVIAERVEVIYDPLTATPEQLADAVNAGTSYRASVAQLPAAAENVAEGR